MYKKNYELYASETNRNYVILLYEALNMFALTFARSVSEHEPPTTIFAENFANMR